MKISRIDDFLRQQEGMTEITRQTIGAMQLGKLNRLLAVLKERVGYYRDLPDHLDDQSELAELPFTTAEELASNAQGLLVLSQSRVSRVLSEVTSGTTGAGKRVFYSEQDQSAERIGKGRIGLPYALRKSSQGFLCLKAVVLSVFFNVIEIDHIMPLRFYVSDQCPHVFP